MIVDDLDVLGAAILPDKAYPPLIVDADTVLALPAAPQRFEAIAGRHFEIVQFTGGIEIAQSSAARGHSYSRASTIILSPAS